MSDRPETTKGRTCPLGDDCDLTAAYMAGAYDARKKCEAEIARLREFVAEVALQTGYTASDGFNAAQPTPLAIRARAALDKDTKG